MRAGPQRPRLRFADIEFGEEDANLDYEISMENDTRPTFIKAFYSHPSLRIDDFEKSTKYFVLGQKGTGKTALLRRVQSDVEQAGGLTRFMHLSGFFFCLLCHR